MITDRYRTTSQALLALFLAALVTAPAVSREVVPAPLHGGPGATAYAADNLPAANQAAPAAAGAVPVDRRTDGPVSGRPGAVAVPDASLGTRESGLRFDDFGGDDVLVWENAGAREVSMDIASNGDIYVAIQSFVSGSDYNIEIYRSRNGGATFTRWGGLDTGANSGYNEACLRVVEGTVSGCFIAYRRVPEGTIGLVCSPLEVEAAAFGPEVVVLSDPAIGFHRPDFDTDVDAFGAFYIYLVAEGDDGTGKDIWFARSTDQGGSFETPYQIATLAFSDRHYVFPRIRYGYGRRLHVAWYFYSADGSFDASIRYRRAANFADGGLADWSNWVQVTTTSDGFDDVYPVIGTSHATDRVALAYTRRSGGVYVNGRVLASADGGGSWTAPAALGGSLIHGAGLEENPADPDIWYLGGLDGAKAGVWTASASDLTAWSGPLRADDRDYDNGILSTPGFALDPAHGDRPGIAWSTTWPGPTSRVLFDGAWRSDPGFPNLEAGFPLGIWAPPVSSPALADVDGDGDLEIVFADELHQIQVINHDGTSPPGWPVNVGVALSDGPVAVGDLDGDGLPTIMVGGTDGRAYAFDPAGNLLPGWPSAISPDGYSCHVAIGAFGGADRRLAVCASKNYFTFRRQSGSAPPGSYGWTISPSMYYTDAPAIGDIDNDGVVEVVAGAGSRIAAVGLYAPSLEFSVSLPSDLSDAITLGDLDLDGDLEILCPTQSGVLYILDHTGAMVEDGFPFDTGSGHQLTSAALGQCLGSAEPEIAFASRDSTVHLLWYDGIEAFGYPNHTGDGWWIVAMPLIGSVKGTSTDIVVASRDRQGWSWDNFGNLIEGWPFATGAALNFAPAMGDLDLDGSNEVVLINDAQIYLADLNNAPAAPSRTWAMARHDAQRTGCSDCPEPQASSAVPELPGPAGAMVRFAAPSPNPVLGATRFEFSIPVPAVVSLDLYDVGGRRVCTIYREESAAGSTSVEWTARDARGAPLAGGQYLARLRVDGPGIREALSRKVIVLP